MTDGDGGGYRAIYGPRGDLWSQEAVYDDGWWQSAFYDDGWWQETLYGDGWW